MHFFCLLFLSLSLFFDTTVLASKKHRYKPFKTQQRRAVEVNRQLKKLRGDENWPKRQAIIQHAVTHRRVNPDALRTPNGFDPDTPLAECVQFHTTDEELKYTELLLKRGANSRALHKIGRAKQPLLFFARTVGMASVLVQHGAHRDVQTNGPELLNGVWQPEREAALIPFFASSGARIDRVTHAGCVPLLTLLSQSDISLDKVRLFMECGAPLELRCREDGPYNGYTVPQYLKAEIEQRMNERKKEFEDPECCDKAIATLQKVRQILMHSQEKRNILFCRSAIPTILPELRTMVGSYGGPYKSYQELENEPLIDVAPSEAPVLERGIAIADIGSQ